MNKDEPSYKKVYRGKFKVSIVLFIVLMTVTIILCNGIFVIIRQKNIVNKNKIVEATLTNYRVIGREQMAYPKIGFYYQYIDENGIKYSGSTTRTFVYGYEAAREAIEEGQTIETYIDGKGNSLEVGAEPSTQKFVGTLISALLFIVVTIAFVVIFLVPKKIKENES